MLEDVLTMAQRHSVVAWCSVLRPQTYLNTLNRVDVPRPTSHALGSRFSGLGFRA